ncbi:UDP-3-O-(3-hydroxymyristoyl)glucosamine N-acyltransferase [Cocleimonas sp. KMM 6892]|uniref:UDP-3-O-(3-hydroxymyristoyl)glucosamine N-acyltransferase n=1 Tax=unclassified Cocleimonas TaxID=2639732 RepID=UPI002DBD80EE|nr:MULTISPECIES: UDP-3-O-(3-hydroxymyristoyl)glucosamine N-acyltransferase [unclassified Cocleimonas]MEB8431016.1 UDP-3-O-(3-hydroxymyristoyl)glucosamine N-acyltransferase [Cocleimonas sp. KMM 6892]MEC4714212.1 UDP-3-O-(3-hydroxymyristoyl)glucosamine N-acyltransferase [Cocleimonas sp. KMM 6895]MEC4743543.1 UDP-3-O-(3-hydroxymyristoyl)glucosamine N-acyltransferase [Cocleimonas sp. KMM 6896]
MKVNLERLAELTDSKVNGDKLLEINAVASLQDAGQGQISFVSNPKYIPALESSNASAVILSPELAKEYEGNSLINSDPYLTFAKVLKIIYSKEKLAGFIHPTAIIHENAEIAADVNIAANVIIESGVTIGKDTQIGAGSYIGEGSHIQENVLINPNVTVYSDTNIGRDCIIHSGAVIGSDGFGFAPTKDKSWYKIPQIGNVILKNDVEVGANCTIDRAALGATIIGEGVKLDCQIHIGHNVTIDDFSIMAAGTVVGGSTSIGKRCQIGGASAISGHLEIADDVVITGKSMVIKSIKSGGVYSSGIPSDANSKWRRNAARFRHLDEMAKTIKELEKRLTITTTKSE